MLSNFGWFELFVIVVLAVIIIGPERLPGVVQDVRAAIFAARKAINNAKAELNGEFGDFGKEFEELRAPLSQAAQWGKLGPRGAITKALFDGDDSAWDDFDPRKPVAGREQDSGNPTGHHSQPPVPPAPSREPHAQRPNQTDQYQQPQAPGQQRPSFDYSTYFNQD